MPQLTDTEEKHGPPRAKRKSPAKEWGTPRLFLSYAREDHRVAGLLAQALGEKGFEVFLDDRSMLYGESFLRRIVGELRRSDGVLALVTTASASSPWCQAELHHAHALSIPVIPIHVGPGEVRLAEPLALMQRETHRLEDDGESGLPVLFDRLGSQLAAVRRAARRRLLRRGVVAAIATAVVATAFATLLAEARDWRQDQRREAVLSQIRDAAQPLPGAVLEGHAAGLSGDGELLNSVIGVGRDPLLSDASRLSAQLLATRLLLPRGRQKRWVVERVDWHDTITRGGQLVETTFASGVLRDVSFEDYTFAGVTWGSANDGMVLSAVRFVRSAFWFTWFAGTNLTDVEFVDCKLRGAEVDLTGFALVRFHSQSPRPEVETRGAITDAVSVFENSVILNRAAPPRPGVMVLGDPRAEVHFQDVIFSATHFRGWIRPEWFQGCTFRNCVFPPSVQREALLKGGNQIEDCYWGSESVD